MLDLHVISSRQRWVNVAEQQARFEGLDAAFTMSNSAPTIPQSVPCVSRRIA
jgi:hypothetical protein